MSLANTAGPLLQDYQIVSELLDCSDLTDTGPRFHQNSGIWLDTQAALQDHGKASGLVTQLDPDATTR